MTPCTKFNTEGGGMMIVCTRGCREPDLKIFRCQVFDTDGTMISQFNTRAAEQDAAMVSALEIARKDPQAFMVRIGLMENLVCFAGPDSP